MTPEERDGKMAGERRDLEQADRHIREAEGRIERQEELIRGLASDGHDATSAEEILGMFRKVLRGFLDHRALIVAELERLAALAMPGDPA